jgi:hypothetical protein
LAYSLDTEHEVRALEPELMRKKIPCFYSFLKLGVQFGW